MTTIPHASLTGTDLHEPKAHAASHQTGADLLAINLIPVTGAVSLGTYTLAAGGYVFNSSPPVDHTATGNIASLVAGTALVFADVCYMGSDGKMERADADLTGNLVPFAMALETIAENAVGKFLLSGIARDDSWNWTALGLPIFLSTVAGGLTQTAPSGAAQEIHIIGIAITADIMYFNPQLIQAEHI